jgi:hypothetical protein
MKALMKTIQKKFDEAGDLAIETIKYEAREILKADPDLDEFIMAMGSCFFTIKEGGKYDSMQYTDEEYEEWCETDDYVNVYSNHIIDNAQTDFQKEFFENVDYLHELFNVMGHPVRFKAWSKEVYDWGDTRKDPIQYEKLEKEGWTEAQYKQLHGLDRGK